jgi:tetratricopeptide (TPR) repeat protein
VRFIAPSSEPRFVSTKRSQATHELLPLATGLHQSGELDRAEAIYRDILRSRPRNVEATYFLAMLCAQKGNLGAAADYFGLAAKLNPDFVEAYFNRGVAFSMLKKFEKALESYDRTLKIRPDHAEALNNRGSALRELKRLDESLRSYDRALTIKPLYAEALNNRGVTLFELNCLAEGLDSYDRAIALSPDYAEAYFNRGVTLNELRRFDDALDSYECATKLKPDYADAHLNLGLCKLLLGDFAGGWPLYEWRNRIAEPTTNWTFSQPVWRGREDIAGKTLLVHAEQGYGDAIQFCRFAKLAETLGAKVIMALPKPLHRLMKQIGQAIEVVDVRGNPPASDYQCSMLSLPLALGTNPEDGLAVVPYLKAEPERVERWKRSLDEQGIKIGINWQGSTGKVDVGRSFPLMELDSISRIPGVRLISLQKNEGTDQLRALPKGVAVETLGKDFDAGPDAFIDSAAVIECMDLVITSDTAIAHLAGALGAPTWLAVKYVPDWRWLLDRRDSPWYPTMRLFRQHSRGDWKSVFDDMRNELLTR